MAVSFLKKFSDSVQANNLLKYRLHKKMAGWEPNRDYHDIIHASDLTKKDFCPRRVAILDITKKSNGGGFIGTSLRATFDLGNALQDSLNQDWGVDWCVGTWECRSCNKLYYFQHRPKECPECNHKYFGYVEERFTHPYLKVSGSVDYLYSGNGARYRIYEIKTMVKDDFKKLVAPLAEHSSRTKLYLRLIDSIDDPRKTKIYTHEASILYICKGYGCKDDSLKDAGIQDLPFSPFKEFTIKRDDSITDVYIDKAKIVRNFRVNGTVPDRTLCPTAMCKTAKDCPVRKECWGN